MTRAIVLAFLLTSCGLEVPEGTIRPVDQMCLPGQCDSGQMCHEGTCYDPCAEARDCEGNCCRKAEDGTGPFCAPREVCE